IKKANQGIKRTFRKSSLKNYDIAKIELKLYIMNKSAVIKELDELIKHLQQPAINPKELIKVKKKAELEAYLKEVENTLRTEKKCSPDTRHNYCQSAKDA
ncbi:5228_t:CDS:2, partial [Scutellospora calospora]